MGRIIKARVTKAERESWQRFTNLWMSQERFNQQFDAHMPAPERQMHDDLSKRGTGARIKERESRDNR